MEILFNALIGGAIMGGVVVVAIATIDRVYSTSYKKKRKIVKNGR
jgi:hypothetical protein